MSLHNSLLSTFCALLCATSVLQAQNGALDLSFNGTGYVITSTGITDEVQEILVQDDQKILAVGWGYYPGLNTESGSVFRYLQDGTLDLSFATDGRFVYAFDYETRFSSAVITPEGKILVAEALATVRFASSSSFN
jgi:hypothetical protein